MCGRSSISSQQLRCRHSADRGHHPMKYAGIAACVLLLGAVLPARAQTSEHEQTVLIQELIKRVQQLEARVAELEGDSGAVRSTAGSAAAPVAIEKTVFTGPALEASSALAASPASVEHAAMMAQGPSGSMQMPMGGSMGGPD